MSRICIFIFICAVTLSAEIRWKCDAKDGKFTMTPCANCKKFYCWDGQIFSETKGYTPPPGYVLAYWDEVHRKSEQIRADIEQKGKELRQQYEQSVENTKRLNEERMQGHKQYMDDLNRRIATQSKTPPPLPRSGMQASTQRVAPKTIMVTAPGQATTPQAPSGPSLPPVSRAKVGEVQAGMNREAVEGILGKPHSAMTIPEDEGMVEVLGYALEDRGTAKVRIEKGKVASVKVLE